MGVAQKKVGINNLVMAYSAHYLNHYCVVSITQKSLLIKDENDQIVAEFQETEPEKYYDVFTMYGMVPDIIIKYIDENIKELNKIKAAKEILADKKNKEEEEN